MSSESNQKQAPDALLVSIADYVAHTTIESDLAYETAQYCLMDTLGCGLLALGHPACSKLLGPHVPETIVPKGARVPGTSYVLDPVKAAFDIGVMNRWLDYNDTWLAAEWGHPSDNLGGILAVADYLNQRGEPLTMKDVLTALIKAYEIQGILALENSLNRVGLDHVAYVKIATAAVVCKLLGGSRDDIIDTLSLAFVDGQSLRTYRHAPNTGTRKSWAAGDATARGVQLALMQQKGEMGYPSVLSVPTWGFEAVCFNGGHLTLARPLGSYVMENILFKINFPAEFHAQTAAECAIKLHQQVAGRVEDITEIVLATQESAVRIINKAGPLHNPADRDHSLQYIVAVGLLYGTIDDSSYSDETAQDPRIDKLRQMMVVSEDKAFTKDYLDAEKRAIGNTVTVTLSDGQSFSESMDYPVGHRRRREEGLPKLIEKFRHNMRTQYAEPQVTEVMTVLRDPATLYSMPVSSFMALWSQ